MEMETSDPPGRSYLAQKGSRGHLVTHSHRYFRKVAVERVDPKSMIHHDGVPGKKHRFRDNHPPRLGRVHRGAGQCREVDTAMRRTCFAIQHASSSEVAASPRAIQRQLEL